MTTRTPARLAPVPDATPPKFPSPLYAEMLELGLNVSELARLADLSRTTLYAVFREDAGTEESARKVVEALEFAREHPGDVPAQPGAVQETFDGSMIEFEVNVDAVGVRVVVRGPMENAPELEAQAAKLIRDMRIDRDQGHAGD